MELLLALPPRRPDPSFRHPLAQRLFADCNLMALDQLLPCQRRSEIAVVLSDQLDSEVTDAVHDAVV
jgi:hypothetical protein